MFYFNTVAYKTILFQLFFCCQSSPPLVLIVAQKVFSLLFFICDENSFSHLPFSIFCSGSRKKVKLPPTSSEISSRARSLKSRGSLSKETKSRVSKETKSLSKSPKKRISRKSPNCSQDSKTSESCFSTLPVHKYLLNER